MFYLKFFLLVLNIVLVLIQINASLADFDIVRFYAVFQMLVESIVDIVFALEKSAMGASLLLAIP